MRAATTIGLTLALLGGGCGGGPDAAAGPPGGRLPACAQARVEGRSAEIPRGFPADFPLPPGLVVTFGAREPGGLLVVNGFVPGDLDTIGQFLLTTLPKRGYDIADSEREQFEMEGDFLGAGLAGKFGIFGSPECPDAVRLLVRIAR